MSDKPHVDQQQIEAGLAEAGLTAGDVVLVHSSLSALGYVEGGADTVVDALLATVGPTGTVVVPTFTWSDFHKAEVAALDLVNSSVKSEVGIIPEAFRNRAEAVRSHHICHSVAAIGPHTPDVLGAGVSSFGEGSTFHQLYELDAWCLFLGATFNSCTELHAVEEYMRVPYRSHRTYEGSTVILPDGTEVPSRSIEFLRHGDHINDFGKMREVFGGHGVLRTAQVGSAEVMNARIRDIFDIAVEYTREDIGFLLTEASREQLHRELGT